MDPKIDVSLNLGRLGALLRNLKGSASSRVLFQAASGVLARAQRKAPVRFGELVNSAQVDPPVGQSVRFGFSKEYAEVMDRGWKVSVIRPVKAQALYIPLTRRGARRGPLKGAVRQLSRSGKKVSGKKTKAQQDFTFAKQVIPRKAVTGSRRGPNRYFSSTIKQVTKDGSLAQAIANLIKKELGT